MNHNQHEQRAVVTKNTIAWFSLDAHAHVYCFICQTMTVFNVFFDIQKGTVHGDYISSLDLQILIRYIYIKKYVCTCLTFLHCLGLVKNEKKNRCFLFFGLRTKQRAFRGPH